MIDRARSDFTVPTAQPVDNSQGVVALRRGLAGVQGGVRQIQADLDQKMQRREAADDAAALIEFENKARLRIADIERTLQDEIPASGDGYVTQFREARKKAFDELQAEIPSYVSETGNQAIANLRLRLEGASDLEATEFQDVAATNWAIDTVENANNQDIAAVMADPDNIAAPLQQAMTRLSAISGRLTPDQERAMRDRTEMDMSQAQVMGFARAGRFADAVSAADALKPRLDIDGQLKLETAIEREISAYEDRLAEAAKQAEAEAQNRLGQLFVSGQLTSDAIQREIPFVGGESAKTWETARDSQQRRGEERTRETREDLSVISEAILMQSVINGEEPLGILNQAASMMAQDALTGSGFSRIYGQIEDFQDQTFQRNLALVNAPFEQSEFFAFDQDTEVAKAKAAREFATQWPNLKNKPQAEIDRAIESIVERAGKELVASLPPVPLPSVATRAPITLQEVNDLRAKVQDEFAQLNATGLLTAEDERVLENDLMRLDDWEARLAVTDGR